MSCNFFLKHNFGLSEPMVKYMSAMLILGEFRLSHHVDSQEEEISSTLLQGRGKIPFPRFQGEGKSHSPGGE